MKVIQDGLWLCADCTQVACNGPDGCDLVDLDATVNGLSRLGPHLVPNFDSETYAGILDFSNISCAACETRMAGYRARFAILG